MTRQRCLGIVCAAAFIAASGAGAAARGIQAAAKPSPAGGGATAAAKASPELVGALAKEMGSTPEQAAGAAGALFGVAKSQLTANDFSTVAKAVPGMDLLLKAAPAAGAVGTAGALSKMAGSAGGLAAAASAFSKLGLKPELVSKALPVLMSFVSKSGGAGVAGLLAGVFK